MKKISIISKQYSISIRTLHYYDSIGLLVPTRKNGVRLYSVEDENRLNIILIYKESGLSLDEIIQILITNDFSVLHKKRDNLIEKRNKLNEMITYIDGIELLNRHPQSTNELVNPFNIPIRHILGDKHINDNYSKYAKNEKYMDKLVMLFNQFNEIKNDKLALHYFMLEYYHYMQNDLRLNITKHQFKEIIAQGVMKSGYFNESDALIFINALDEFILN